MWLKLKPLQCFHWMWLRSKKKAANFEPHLCIILGSNSFFLCVSQIHELQVHAHSDFGANLCCHLWPFQPLARRFGKCSLHCHIIFLPEAPCQARVAEVAVQDSVQPAVQLGDLTEKCHSFICIVLCQSSVQLGHGKAPCFEVGIISWADRQIFCIIFQNLFCQDIHLQPSFDLSVARVCSIHESLPQFKHGFCQCCYLCSSAFHFWPSFFSFKDGKLGHSPVPVQDLLLLVHFQELLPAKLQIVQWASLQDSVAQKPKATSQKHHVGSQVFAVHKIICCCTSCEAWQ